MNPSVLRLPPALALCLALHSAAAGEAQGEKPAVVSFVKVLSDKVEDVSSLEAWKKSFIKDGMSDEQKGVAIFQSVVRFIHHDMYALELLNVPEGCVHDPIKAFNVYGHSFCCCTSAYMCALARAIGFEGRGWGTPGHSVPEIKYAGEWHMLDPAFINYFPKADGKIASIEELTANISEWLEKNPGLLGDAQKQVAFMRGQGWKKGPEVLTRCPFFSENGWLPEGGHSWSSMLSQFGDRKKAFVYEYNYSLGYRVNNQLRRGQRLIFNWANQGLYIGKDEGTGVYSVTGVPGKDMMKYCPEYGDLTQGRVGNGRFEYSVPLDAGLVAAALQFDNLETGADAPSLRVKDPAKPGILVLRLPCSYVYLAGELAAKTVVAGGGSIKVECSDNQGRDWKEIGQASSAELNVPLKNSILRRYDYRLRFTLQGAGTGLNALKVVNDIQHSQRALPTLTQGENKITFSAGPAEGTITIEGSTDPKAAAGKQLSLKDLHADLKGVKEVCLIEGATGVVTLPVETPGDMVRLRMSAAYRARDEKEGWDVCVSFDNGKTFKAVDRLAGPVAGMAKSMAVNAPPEGCRNALVKFSGTQRVATMLFNIRIDADYKEPHGGFAPVTVTYQWEENGQPKQDVHVVKQENETWTIKCDAKPLMKAMVLERAD